MVAYHVVFEEKNKVSLKEFQVRSLKPNDVMVRIDYTLISNGTERAYLSAMPNTARKFPSVPGYNGVGYVEQVGDKVTNLNLGDRVFVAYGGHASYSVKDQSNVFKIPDNVDFLDAVFTKMASYPLHGIRNTYFELGESIAVVGLGVLGLLGVQLAKIGGGVPVIGIGNREIRRNLAIAFGADYVYDPNEINLAKKVVVNTDRGAGVNVVIDTSGSTDALIAAAGYMAKYGRISIVGCNRIEDKALPIYQMQRKGIHMIGSHSQTHKNFESCAGIWTVRRNFQTILSYMSDGRLTPRLMNPVLFTPEMASEVYEQLLNDREFPLGVIFDWSKFH